MQRQGPLSYTNLKTIQDVKSYYNIICQNNDCPIKLAERDKQLEKIDSSHIGPIEQSIVQDLDNPNGYKQLIIFLLGLFEHPNFFVLKPYIYGQGALIGRCTDPITGINVKFRNDVNSVEKLEQAVQLLLNKFTGNGFTATIIKDESLIGIYKSIKLEKFIFQYQGAKIYARMKVHISCESFPEYNLDIIDSDINLLALTGWTQAEALPNIQLRKQTTTVLLTLPMVKDNVQNRHFRTIALDQILSELKEMMKHRKSMVPLDQLKHINCIIVNLLIKYYMMIENGWTPIKPLPEEVNDVLFKVSNRQENGKTDYIHCQSCEMELDGKYAFLSYCRSKDCNVYNECKYVCTNCLKEKCALKVQESKKDADEKCRVWGAHPILSYDGQQYDGWKCLACKYPIDYKWLSRTY